MPVGATSASIVNQALEQIASQSRITSLADNTPEAKYALIVYAPTVQVMLRTMDPDFARFTAALTLSAAVTPVPPWAFEYLYPADMLRLRQVRPAAGAYDPNDPQPVRANVATDLIANVLTKVILCNQANALAVYTSSAVTEAMWDAAFEDAVVRRLANPLAMALSGRPDFAREILQQSGQMAMIADSVDEGGFRKS